MPPKGRSNKSNSSSNNDVFVEQYTPRRNVTEQFVDDAIAAVKANILDTVSIEINKSIDLLKESIIEELTKQNKLLSTKVQNLEEDLGYVYDRLFTLESEMYDQQQRSRRNNIEIHGIPNEILDENLEKTSIEMLNNIVDNPIDPEEIDACHRLPGKGNSKPVIMRFVKRKRRNEIMENGSMMNNEDVKANLRRFGVNENNRIYINHNLSPKFKTLSYHCRCLRREGKIFKITYDNAKLKIKIKENDRKWKKIGHEEDIIELFPDYNIYDE